SYSSWMKDLAGFLQSYFSNNNLILIYPEQFGDQVNVESFSDPLAADIAGTPSPLWSKLRAWGRMANNFKKRFTQRGRRAKNKIEL
ncbi:MAG: cation:proton antiporter, partial [Muribaculaceae bacterium]|nr:cation:proton antiporter [Muribaculaceae bacterium]